MFKFGRHHGGAGSPESADEAAKGGGIGSGRVSALAGWVFLLVAALGLAGLAAVVLRGSRAGDSPGRPSGLAQFTFEQPQRPAPDAAFTEGGVKMTLGAFKGKVILLNLWATWCGPCVRELPALDRLQWAMGGPRFQVVTVSEDRGAMVGNGADGKGADKVAAFLKDHGWAALRPYRDDRGALAQAFGVGAIPTSFLIDAQGRVVGKVMGGAAWDSPAAKALIQRVIAGRG